MEEKELYRSKEGKRIAGVCVGMANYMNLTPRTVRWIFVLMAFFFGGGILVYIASIFMFPWEPETVCEEEAEAEEPEELEDLEELEED